METAKEEQPFSALLKEQLGSFKFKLFAGITVLFLVLDQVTKIWVVKTIEYRREEIKILDGFLSFVHAQNPGAAFGIMSDSPMKDWIFPIFTVIAVGLLLQMMWQLEKDDKFQTTAVALIMSGALGNFIDRVHKGTVTDFIRVYTENESLKPWLIDKVGTNEWPSFNIADSAIVVGLCLFVLHYFLFERDEADMEPDPPAKSLAE